MEFPISAEFQESPLYIYTVLCFGISGEMAGNAVMRFFRLIASGVDVASLLEEIRLQDHAWLLNTSRQDKIQVQRDNKQFHESFNESDEWRVHYIFDLLHEAYKHLGVNPVLLPPETLEHPESHTRQC